MAVLGSILVHEGNDPFTPPRTKTVWVNSSIPAVKVPVIKYSYMKTRLEVVVHGPDGDEVKAQFDRCMQKAAIKSLLTGLVAGYASGGAAALSAAMTTFVVALDDCVERALSETVNLTAEVENEAAWGPWQ